jgi:hypothetical protein
LKFPTLRGAPLRIEIRPSLGPHLAATSIPKRLILLDRTILLHPGDFERILIHEIFHFVWVRLGNLRRWSWEELLALELCGRIKGELGWSAEWRKAKVTPKDVRGRTKRWRLYVCESFCDTAAWLYSGLEKHEEFTLDRSSRSRRREWFRGSFEDRPASI